MSAKHRSAHWLSADLHSMTKEWLLWYNLLSCRRLSAAASVFRINHPDDMQHEPIALDVKLFGETNATVIKRELEALDSSVRVDVVSNWYQDKRLYVYISPSAYERYFHRAMPTRIARAIEHCEQTTPRYRDAH